MCYIVGMRIDWETYSVRLISVGRAAWRAGVQVDSSYDKTVPVTDHGLNYFPPGAAASRHIADASGWGRG
jgi:hypothetical protein